MVVCTEVLGRLGSEAIQPKQDREHIRHLSMHVRVLQKGRPYVHAFHNETDKVSLAKTNTMQ
jgi:hypothetical protein